MGPDQSITNSSPWPHQLSVSVTRSCQLTEKTTITVRNSGLPTGKSTEPPDQTIKTAVSPNPTTGRVPNSALSHGNAEVPDSAREVDGAPDMTVAKEPHSQTKLQASPQTTEITDLTQREFKMS